MCLALILALAVSDLGADEVADLAQVAPEVLGEDQRRGAAGMIERDIRKRTAVVNAQNRAEWSRIKTREHWEKYRDERIDRCAARSESFRPLED